MTQHDLVIRHHAPRSDAQALPGDDDLRSAYRTAVHVAEVERLTAGRRAMRTLGTTTATCCGLLLNLPYVSAGTEMALTALTGAL